MQQAVLPQVPKALKVWRVHDDPNKSREGDVAPNRVMNALHSTFCNLCGAVVNLRASGTETVFALLPQELECGASPHTHSSVDRSSDAFLRVRFTLTPEVALPYL